MNEWMVLGLSATTDQEAVRKAYMTQLKQHNPEDDPEGFRRVRAAYEHIIRQLNEPTQCATEDNSPTGQFMVRVAALYETFDQRIDPAAWRELLTDDACVRLDLEDETSEQLLQYFMDHYYLPRAVWQLLNEHFGWTEKDEQLKRTYPVNFMDFIHNSIQQENLNYTLFEYDTLAPPETKQYDRWIYLYYEIDNLLSSPQDAEGNNKTLLISMQEEIKSLPLRHVYFDLQCARQMIWQNEPEEALRLAQTVLKKLPEDYKARYTTGLALLSLARYEESTAVFRQLLTENAQDFGARRGLIDTMIAEGKLEDARAELLKILDVYPFNPYALNTFHYINEKLIALYEKKHQENPDDHDISLMLAKHYLNGYQYTECRALLESFTPTAHEPRYYEFLADCLSNAQEHEQAIVLYEKNTESVKEYHNYAKYISVLLDAEQYERALEKVSEALTFEDDDSLSLAYLYDNKGQALHHLGRYEEALSAYDEGLRINNQTAFIYTHKAKTCQRMNRYAEAVDLCEQAVHLYPYLTEAYTIQMEIFYDADLYDRMLELAELAELFHFDSPCVQYFKACALRMKNEMAQAEQILTELLKAEYDEGYRDYFHAEMAYIAMAREHYDDALHSMTESLRINNEPVYRYAFLGNIQRLRGAFAEALSIYDKMIADWPDLIGAYMGRGNVYYDQKDYPRALADFQRALDINEHNEQAFDRIIDTYLSENRYADALPVAEREQALFDNMENALRLAWLYDKTGQVDIAGAAYEAAITRFADNDRPFARYGYYCKSTLNDYEKAISLFRKALSLNPAYVILYSEIAFCQCQIKQYTEALSTVDEGLRQHEGACDLYIRRGLVLSYLQRHEEALQDLLRGVEKTEAVAERWNLPFLYNRIGVKYELYHNDAQNALKYYRMALEQDEGYADAYKNLGDLYRYHFNKYKEALRYYNIKISIEPDRADGYLARGHAKASRLFKRGALADYQKALTLYEIDYKNDPEDLCLLTHIADCLLGMGNLTQAREYYLQVIAHAPDNERCEKGICDEAYFGMGRLCERMKQYEEALAYYEKAVSAVNSVQYNRMRDQMRKKLKGKSTNAH